MTRTTTDAPAWSRVDTVSIVVVLIAAALLRLVNLNCMEFKGDEAENLFAAGQIFHGHFPLVGIPSSIGTDNPPLFTYLLMIPLAVSRNPIVAAAFIAVLNCAAAGLLYLFCKRFFTTRVAQIASIFFAINPWAVLYSRKIWQQDVLPIAVIGFFFCLFLAAFEKKPKALLGACACYAAMTQLHLSSVFYGAVMVALLVWQSPKIRWGYYMGGVGIVLLTYLPYIAFDITHQGRNLHLYLHPASSAAHFQSAALSTPFVLGTTGYFLHYFDFGLLDVITGALIGAGAIYALFNWRDAKLASCAMWFFVPVLFLLFSKVDLVPHYFIAFYPIQFVLIAIALDALTKFNLPRYPDLVHLPSVVAIVLALYQLQATAKLLDVISQHRNIAWMEYGPPYRDRKSEIDGIVGRGLSDPAAVQDAIVRSKPEQALFKYDFAVTRFIVENSAGTKN